MCFPPIDQDFHEWTRIKSTVATETHSWKKENDEEKKRQTKEGNSLIPWDFFSFHLLLLFLSVSLLISRHRSLYLGLLCPVFFCPNEKFLVQSHLPFIMSFAEKSERRKENEKKNVARAWLVTAAERELFFLFVPSKKWEQDTRDIQNTLKEEREREKRGQLLQATSWSASASVQFFL